MIYKQTMTFESYDETISDKIDKILQSMAKELSENMPIEVSVSAKEVIV